ncbi:MAG: radical SAM protein [Candidatus Thorarchaeota archaeon SMTZ1-45]|nr:MAG: radical SAM protein [Candidatus Thorarchaeota archaeon SMTZ1-45]
MLPYEGSIWRPPSEARSLILQATVGCSHNACIFCVSYKQKSYKVRGAKGVQSDLNTLPHEYKQHVKRVFLADGNALAMSTDELIKTLNVLKPELPMLERVGIYGYARDVRDKTVDNLISIKDAGLGIVYLGLETGDDELLRWARKGVGSRENIDACKKIRNASIPLSLTIILGLGGLEHSERHAQATAKALNEIDPEYIGALTLMTPPGTRISEMIKDREFEPMDPMDILKELKILVEGLELTNCIFRTNHASNYLPIRGTLGRDKEAMVQVLSDIIRSDDESRLRPSYLRGL